MSDDPAHKAMLYFLEVLMNSNGPLTISQLAGRFGSRNFSAEMRTAAGGNESGLKKFLLKYPSLFTVRNNMVSLFDGKSSPRDDDGRDDTTSSSSALGRTPLPDVSTELAAVQYFQQKLIKKEEKWVQICSLAGHLSQADAHIRGAVGPQLDFRKWLLKHPHIFDVQGELVGLKDGVAAVATPAIPRRITFDETQYVKPVPPKTPPASRRVPKSPAAIRRSFSFGEKHQYTPPSPRPQSIAGPPDSGLSDNSPTTPVLSRKDAPVTMTANEYKSITFLKDIIEKKGNIRLQAITSHFSQTSEGVRNTIGWTKPEIEKFVRSHATVFSLDDDLVSVVKNAKLNVIITGSRPSGGPVRTLNGRKGKIFHVAKLWGIIDLGKHEHVFFDKSIMRRPVEDLSKEYRPNDTLYFHAVLAPKSSRAKWRATHVWGENEQAPTGSQMDLSNIDTSSNHSSSGPLSPANSIEDEINRFLPNDSASIDSTSRAASEKYNDAEASSAGSVKVYNYKGSGESMMVPERYQLSQPTDLSPKAKSNSPLTNGVTNGNAPPVVQKVKTYAEIGCQTISTGDIIATHLYYED